MTENIKDELHHLIDRAGNKSHDLETRLAAVRQALHLLWDESHDLRNEDEADSIERVKRAYGVGQ